MIRTRLTSIASLVVLAVAFPSLAAAMPLRQAIAEGKVEVTVTGRGTSTGDSIQVIVQRRIPQTLEVEIESGTVFKSQSRRVQDMAARAVKYEVVSGRYRAISKIVLADQLPHTYIVEAYCREFGKPTPRAGSGFNVAMPDPIHARILIEGKRAGAGTKVLQAATWMRLSRVSDAELRQGFRITAEELRAARSLLTSLDASPADAQQAGETLQAVLAQVRSAAEAAMASIPIKPGDKVPVGKDGAQLTPLFLGDPLPLAPGTQVEVLAGGVFVDQALVRVTVDGRRRRGRVPIGKLDIAQKVASQTPPLPSAEDVRQGAEVILETFNKLTR